MSNKTSTKEQVLGIIAKKAFVADSRGSLNIDGVFLRGISGKRTIGMLLEGVGLDEEVDGARKTINRYEKIARKPGELGRLLEISHNLSNLSDSMEIAEK